MSGMVPRLSNAGPNTYPVSEAVRGGHIVEAFTDGKARKSRAGSVTVLGVANIDAKPWVNPVSTDVDGFEVINTSPLPTEVTAEFGRFVVEYTTNAAFGDALIAAADGKVAVAGVAPDARTLIGYCDEPAGVVIATNAFGLANISR